MICYRDRTYCLSNCTNESCYRFLSDFEATKASELGLPIAWTDFSGTCEEYKGDN